MDAVALLDRRDTKYAFHISMLNSVLHSLTEDYYILSVNGVRLHKYESHYLDTSQYDFYHMHHNAFGERVKVRYRHYVNSALTFFEVKRKINTNRTIKKRIVCARTGEDDSRVKEFYRKTTNSDFNDLLPKVQVDFSRLTLVSKDFTERATFDLYLSFRSHNRNRSYNDLVIAEVKQGKINHASKIIKALKSMHINNTSLSKYCMGIYELYEGVKKNNFKPQKHNINKILSQQNGSI